MKTSIALMITVLLLLAGCVTPVSPNGPWEYRYVRVDKGYVKQETGSTTGYAPRLKAEDFSNKMSKHGWTLVCVEAVAENSRAGSDPSEGLLLVFKRLAK